jgi:hypothetical protein
LNRIVNISIYNLFCYTHQNCFRKWTQHLTNSSEHPTGGKLTIIANSKHQYFGCHFPNWFNLIPHPRGCWICQIVLLCRWILHYLVVRQHKCASTQVRLITTQGRIHERTPHLSHEILTQTSPDDMFAGVTPRVYERTPTFSLNVSTQT